MRYQAFVSALAFASVVSSGPLAQWKKRDPTLPFEIVAYQIEQEYIKLFYSDGNDY